MLTAKTKHTYNSRSIFFYNLLGTFSSGETGLLKAEIDGKTGETGLLKGRYGLL